MTSSIHPRTKLMRWSGAAAVGLLLSLALIQPAAAGGDPQRVGFGQPMRVDAGERVDTIVTIGGDLTVNGDVEDDAVVIGGNLELGPEARVGGDAVAVGGTIIAPDSATILGDRVEVSGTYGREVGEYEMTIEPLATSIGTFIQVVASFLISALILAFVPRRVRGVAEHMRARPGRAFLFGLAILLLFLPLLGALTISIVGIPLIPVAFMLLALVIVFGMTALGLRIGYAMPFYSETRSAFGALAIGYLIIALVGLIPWVGAILVPLAGLFAGGATLASWFGGRTAITPPAVS
jgi:hypothetical protein